MYDAREKAIRDQQWALKASRKEGIIEGKIEGVKSKRFAYFRRFCNSH